MLAHHLVQAVEYGRAAGLDVTHTPPEGGEGRAGRRRPGLGARCPQGCA